MVSSSIVFIAPISLLAAIAWTISVAHDVRSRFSQIHPVLKVLLTIAVYLVCVPAIGICLSLVSVWFAIVVIGVLFPVAVLVFGIIRVVKLFK